MEKEVILGNGRLAFGDGVEVATLRMHCCNAAGTGGRDCDNIGSGESACGITPVLSGMDKAVDIVSSLDA